MKIKEKKQFFKKTVYLNIILFLLFILINSCRTSIIMTESPGPPQKKTVKAPRKVSKQKPNNSKLDSETSLEPYPIHKRIKTTFFYIGEKDIYKSGVIDNGSSAWTENWVKAYGGIDFPDKRDGYFPAGFIPKENPFYFALPYNDVTDHGHKESVKSIPILKKWKTLEDSKGSDDFVSYCKNKWIKINYRGKVCYAQWEDVGPFETDDVNYVFGNARPKNKKNGGVGLDISPACFKYLGMKDNDYTDWQFVDFKDVPDGPWLKYITISNPKW